MFSFDNYQKLINNGSYGFAEPQWTTSVLVNNTFAEREEEIVEELALRGTAR